MADYIDREAAIREAEKYGLSDGSVIGRHSGIADCIASDISRIPAADVAPVRRGHWIPIYASELTGWNPEFAGCDPIAGYRCSRCGADAILSCNDDFVLSNYCPNCGAKMEANHGRHHQIPD